MRAVPFQTHDLQNRHPVENITGKEDPDVYVGDEVVIERLNKLIQNIKDGIYNEETKQEIYYYGEYYLDVPPSAYIQQVNEAAKYFVTGWWLHSLINNEEKLMCESKTALENKQ